MAREGGGCVKASVTSGGFRSWCLQECIRFTWGGVGGILKTFVPQEPIPPLAPPPGVHLTISTTGTQLVVNKVCFNLSLNLSTTCVFDCLTQAASSPPLPPPKPPPPTTSRLRPHLDVEERVDVDVHAVQGLDVGRQALLVGLLHRLPLLVQVLVVRKLLQAGQLVGVLDPAGGGARQGGDTAMWGVGFSNSGTSLVKQCCIQCNHLINLWVLI